MTVALFPTCLVDLTAARVGFAVVKVLRHFGIEVDVPDAALCCGQPAFNSGHVEEALPILERTVRALAPYEAVIVPSGSCGAMLTLEAASALEGEARALAESLRARTFEFTAFLADKLGAAPIKGRFEHRVMVHGSCHATRWLGLEDTIPRLIGGLDGIELLAFPHPQTCCGFGGTFSVHFPELSAAMADEKLRPLVASGADVLVGGDMGCLLHLGGRLRHEGLNVRPMHIAELLADALGVA